MSLHLLPPPPSFNLECRNQFFGCEKIPFVVVFVRKEGKNSFPTIGRNVNISNNNNNKLFIQSDFLPTVLKGFSRVCKYSYLLTLKSSLRRFLIFAFRPKNGLVFYLECLFKGEPSQFCRKAKSVSYN